MRRVNERWVCKRCFADNQGEAATCARCGLARGSESTDADRQQWASAAGLPDPTGGDQPAWRGLLRFWWVPVLLITLGVGWFTAARRGDDGALSGAGTVQVDDLRAGDCFNAGEETEISDVHGVPCDEPHAYEVFAVQTYGGGALPASDAQLETVFGELCVPPFQTYVGTAYQTSELWASFVTPTEDGWNDGDREFICYLFEEDESTMTRSMAGASR